MAADKTYTPQDAIRAICKRSQILDESDLLVGRNAVGPDFYITLGRDLEVFFEWVNIFYYYKDRRAPFTLETLGPRMGQDTRAFKDFDEAIAFFVDRCEKRRDYLIKNGEL